MERIDSAEDIEELLENNEYLIAFLTEEQRVNIPSTKGIYFYNYEEECLDYERDKLLVFYDRRKFYNYNLDKQHTDILEEVEKYLLVEDVDIEPTFYMRRRSMYESED